VLGERRPPRQREEQAEVAFSGPELALEVGPGHYVIGRSIVVRQTPAELLEMALRLPSFARPSTTRTSNATLNLRQASRATTTKRAVNG
jgi:hypothetical protein